MWLGAAITPDDGRDHGHDEELIRRMDADIPFAGRLQVAVAVVGFTQELDRPGTVNPGDDDVTRSERFGPLDNNKVTFDDVGIPHRVPFHLDHIGRTVVVQKPVVQGDALAKKLIVLREPGVDRSDQRNAPVELTRNKSTTLVLADEAFILPVLRDIVRTALGSQVQQVGQLLVARHALMGASESQELTFSRVHVHALIIAPNERSALWKTRWTGLASWYDVGMEKKVEEKIDAMAKDISDLKDSIEVLAQSVARGFARVDERFEAVDRRFDTMDERLATKEELQGAKLDLIDRVASKHTVDDHELRLQALEAHR